MQEIHEQALEGHVNDGISGLRYNLSTFLPPFHKTSYLGACNGDKEREEQIEGELVQKKEDILQM